MGRLVPWPIYVPADRSDLLPFFLPWNATTDRRKINANNPFPSLRVENIGRLFGRTATRRVLQLKVHAFSLARGRKYNKISDSNLPAHIHYAYGISSLSLSLTVRSTIFSDRVILIQRMAASYLYLRTVWLSQFALPVSHSRRLQSSSRVSNSMVHRCHEYSPLPSPLPLSLVPLRLGSRILPADIQNRCSLQHSNVQRTHQQFVNSFRTSDGSFPFEHLG